MKYLIKIWVVLIVMVGLSSCDKNVEFEILEKQDSFHMVTPVNGTLLVLTDENLDNQALFISWHDPNYSSDKTYTVEVALTGTDFENPVVLGTTQSFNYGMSVDEVNSFMLDILGLNPEEAVSLDIRVLSSDEEQSDVSSVVITPYTVEYTELYLVGNFTNWNPEEAIAMTNVGFNLFEITQTLADGDEFKFLPTNTGWDGDFGKDPDNDGMLLQEGESNLDGYTAGDYKISVDLSAMTYTVEEIVAPTELFLVGSINGWDPASAYPFNNPKENVFTLVVDLPADAQFKFLPTNTGWDGDWGEDPNNPGMIVVDEEQNVSGYAAGKYLVTVDFNNYTYSLSSVDNLYLVGSLTGWDPATSLPMTEASLGTFSIVIDLPDGAEFKFLPTNTGWDGDWGQDNDNAGLIIQDDESNVSGYAAGTYVIAVDFNTLSYSVSSVTSVPSTLFLVGSFNGWSNDAGSPQFTEVSSGVFQIVQTLSDTDEFKFVPVAGSWSDDWGKNANLDGVLEQNSEQNIPSPGANTYLITVDFNSGTYSVQ